MRLLPVALIAALLGGCQFLPGTEQHTVASAKKAVSAQLKDPASAVFSEVTSAPGIACGLVNAKNSFGGYVGGQKFVWSPGREALLESSVRPSEPHAAATHDAEQCTVRRAYATCKAGQASSLAKVRLACSDELAGFKWE